MKALQNKLLILIVSSTLFPALVVMAIAFSNYGRIDICNWQSERQYIFQK